VSAWHFLAHFLGADYGLPYGQWGAYNTWSGAGSDIGELGIIGGLAVMVRRHNCEVRRCWRLGRHWTAGGHVVCRKHHPGGPLTAERVTYEHHAALAARRDSAQ
jgi:hypothetical protein